MLILSRVCAEFRARNGEVIHRITPAMLGLFHDAPEAIRGDLLFNMLLADGSIRKPEDARKDKELEQDPMAGATADGREIVPEKGTDAAVKSAKGTKAKASEKPAEAEQK